MSGQRSDAALLAPTPPPPHLVPEPPLHLLPAITFTPGSELAIPGYKCSVHVFPAAWPRITPFVPLPADLQERVDESKEERKTRIARATELLISNKAAYERAQGQDDSGRVLWITATRWVRINISGGDHKTLLCAHANGIHGTTYTSALRRPLAHRADIAEVWTLDGVQHGDAALLNAGRLGIVDDWHELARDALCFMQHFLPPELDPAPLPTLLPRISRGSRKVYALGHSWGACALVIAATGRPELFNALILADPVILPPEIGPAASGLNALKAHVVGALSRRSRWPSRAAAYEALASNPFFGSWDKEVLDIYVKHALAEDERTGGEVRLKCEGVNEAAVFAETRTSREAWRALPLLDERVPVLWISPPAGKAQFVLRTQELADARVRLRPANSAHVTIPNGTHLIVQTHPRQVASAIHAFLQAVDGETLGDVRELDVPSRARL